MEGNQKLLPPPLKSANFKTGSLKKLILDTCTKTAFSFSNMIYDQKDGVSMGSLLGPVMANIMMTELENKVIKPLTNYGTVKFYCWYVGHTLRVVKPQDTSHIHELNGFDKNFKFTIDLLDNEVDPFFSTRKSYRMESRFTGRTLTLCYIWIIQVLCIGFTVLHGLEA